ncbi:MAG: DUF2520 domain-containing protein [Lachnospiraceae bacterium]|nr:DUF2520 domain-containing protein [Lachnospiraceae bacterium]
MKIGIIGAGKVGTTMGKYIADHGGTVTGFCSRTESSAREAAQFTKTRYFTSLEALIEGSDTLFITTTDDAIKTVWDCITTRNVKGKVICHFSGSLSSDIFSDWERTGAEVCSIHPIYAFSNKFTAYKNLTTAKFSVEGSEGALQRMQALFALLPNEVVRISTEEKAKYHAATSLASNHVTGLIYLAIALLKESGIEEQTAYGLLKPLAEQNIEAIFSQKDSAAGGGFSGCAQTLTGPIERGDIMTVKKHLDHLERPEWKAVYRAVGLQVTEAAVKKHPERSYEEMKQILAQ